MKSAPSKNNLFTAVLLTALVVGGVSFYASRTQIRDLEEKLVQLNRLVAETQDSAPSSPTKISDASPVLDDTSKAALTGSIEGSVSYPSEGIPDDLEVCAINISTQNIDSTVCTNQFIEDSKFTNGIGYRLNLNPGKYQVEARRPNSPLKGLYTQFVQCGQTVRCTDHTPIEVQVNPHQINEGIDPGDWYGS